MTSTPDAPWEGNTIGRCHSLVSGATLCNSERGADARGKGAAENEVLLIAGTILVWKVRRAITTCARCVT